jgi:hypothetical protein
MSLKNYNMKELFLKNMSDIDITLTKYIEEDELEIIEEEYEVGLFIKEEMIPYSIEYYLNLNKGEDVPEDGEEDEKKCEKKINKIKDKEVQALIFDKYLRDTNNAKSGNQSVAKFFVKK